MAATPLHRDTLALCGVLLEELEGHGYDDLRRRLAGGSLRLLDQVTLALGGFERGERLHDADAELATLRVHLQLAYELGILDEDTFLALAEQADTVGRQLGGWLKKLRRHPDG